MNKNEALKLALEALMEHGAAYLGHSKEYQQAIIKSKEALAQPDYRSVKTYHEGKPVYVSQPEQKPYGWIDVYGHFWNHKTSEDDVPLYTTTPTREWVALTDEQRLEMADNSAAYQVVLATEAKLKEKNT